MELRLKEHSHRRFNPLAREWVLVSPHRTKRPWQGAVESNAKHERLRYDPSCYLCPGNQRASGARNTQYESTFVFENDFASLKKDNPLGIVNVGGKGLLVAEGEQGICRVMCFSPRHDLTLSTMSIGEIGKVVHAWIEQTNELSAMPGMSHVQIFENRGEMMGASNPHPHCQIWATSSIPQAPLRELQSQQEYRQKQGRCMLCDYIELEQAEKERLVCSNDDFLALVPFWAVWPFEILLISRHHWASLPELNAAKTDSLSRILKQIVSTYDHVFDAPFPYSMGLHQAPSDNSPHPEWHFHAHFYPPLLRSATVRKFMVGFEMLGTPQRDITPEFAAEKLRSAVRKEQA